jgi:hypothetical protein
LKFCESKKKTELETIEILEIMFDYYRSGKNVDFFKNDFFVKYSERLEEIRHISYGDSYQDEEQTLFI